MFSSFELCWMLKVSFQLWGQWCVWCLRMVYFNKFTLFKLLFPVNKTTKKFIVFFVCLCTYLIFMYKHYTVFLSSPNLTFCMLFVVILILMFIIKCNWSMLISVCPNQTQSATIPPVFNCIPLLVSDTQWYLHCYNTTHSGLHLVLH